MKHAAWKIALLALVTILLLGVTATALAEEKDNAFSFTLIPIDNTLNLTPGDSVDKNFTLDTAASTLIMNYSAGSNALELKDKATAAKAFFNPDWVQEIEVALTEDKPMVNTSATYTNVKKGSHTVTVSAKDADNVSTALSVSGAYKISLNKSSQSVVKGFETDLEVNYAGGLEKTWKSSNTKVVTITANNSGKKNPSVHVKAVGAGTATISCTVTDSVGNKQTASIKLTVYAMDKTTKTIYVGETATISVPNASKLTVAWSSADSSIVKITKKSGNTATIKGMKIGKAKVTAKVDGKTLTCTVTVKKSPYPMTMKVKTDNGGPLYLRQKASTSSAALGRYAVGTKVTVLGITDGWAKVKVGGKTGYMMSKFLVKLSGSDSGSSSSTTPKNTKYAEVINNSGGSYVNLRKTANTEASNVLAKLALGTKLDVVKWGGTFTQVKYKTYTGYVMTCYLKPITSK